jgi:hypothetical protein
MPASTARTARLRSAAWAGAGNDRVSSSATPGAYATITPFAYRSNNSKAYGDVRAAKTPASTALGRRSMVRMGSPVRFRRGAPPQNQQLRRVQHPTCRVTESRQPPFARELPVRLVLSESECVAHRVHSKAPLAPVDLTPRVRPRPQSLDAECPRVGTRTSHSGGEDSWLSPKRTVSDSWPMTRGDL